MSVGTMPHVHMALGMVNASLPRTVDAAGLREAVVTGGPAGRVLLEEAPAPLLHGLVLEGLLGWHELEEAAARFPPARDDTRVWIKDMARLALA